LTFGKTRRNSATPVKTPQSADIAVLRLRLDVASFQMEHQPRRPGYARHYPTEIDSGVRRERMTTIFGKFYWIGELPDDEDVERAPEPIFSGDFGEQWQYMATEPVITSVCDALRSEEMVAEIDDPSPEDHGWYTYFKIDGWTFFLYVQWVPDGDKDNCFEFDVRIRNDWFHRMIHRSQNADRIRAVGAAVARILDSATDIEGVAFNQRAC